MNVRQHGDSGFGMVEIIVSMLMLAILAVVLAPVIIGGVRSTAKMSTIATATQMVNDGLETQRAELGGGGCPALPPNNTEPPRSDSRGVSLKIEVDYTNLATCSTSGLLNVSVRVTTVGQTPLFPGGRELAAAHTQVYVS